MQCGGQGGCKGAIPELAFNYLQIAGGQTTEYMMPYTSYKGDNGNCSFNNTAHGTPAAVTIDGYVRVKSNDVAAVMNAVQLGPLAVSVDAGGWQHYESGIYDAPFKSNSTTIDIDHVVQMVGYGVDAELDDTPYWIIRNSWATGWGEKGFMRIQRSPNPDKPICKDDTTVLDGTGCEFQKDIVQHPCGPAGILFDVAYPLGAALA